MNPKERYQDLIFEHMARTLWVMAYADWVENNGESDEQSPDELGPGPGGDWDDVTPETPVAALQAAHELGELFAAANKLATGRSSQNYPMFELFKQAMEVHLGHSFTYDEPWHTQIKEDPKDKELRSVYADWLEQQGRVSDAEYVRRSSGQQVADFMGQFDLAQQFGSDMAMEALGTGVAWSDDHYIYRDAEGGSPARYAGKTPAGAHIFDPYVPRFECYYDGESLHWSGSVDDKDARPSRLHGGQQARWQGQDEPLLTGELGEDVLLQGKIRIRYINESDASWTKHAFVLWFGGTYLMIYANSLEDALDEGIDWVAENQPGLIVDEQVNEQFTELKTEREAVLGREMTWEEDNNELDQMLQEAEADTTTGGNYGNHINSDTWGIVAEDPSPVELLRIAGLTKNNPPVHDSWRNPMFKDNARKKKTPPSAYDQLATVMFRNTITARMLRALATKGSMTQAEFMRDYMRRCERKPTVWSGDKVNFSSFSNNFGRFVIGRDGMWPDRRTGWASGGPKDGTSERPLRVIKRTVLPAKSKETSSTYLRQQASMAGRPMPKAIDTRMMLYWAGPTIDDLLAKISREKLEWAYANLERELVSDSRKTDDPAETGAWVERLRAAQSQYKATPNPTSRVPYTRKRFGDSGGVTSVRHSVPVPAPGPSKSKGPYRPVR